MEPSPVRLGTPHPLLSSNPQDLNDRWKKFVRTGDKEIWDNFLRLIKCILPHLCLLFITASYICIGAALFLEIIPPRVEERRSIQTMKLLKLKEKLADSLWNITQDSSSGGMEAGGGDGAMDEYVQSLYGVFASGIDIDIPSHSGDTIYSEWNFGNALFFIVTTLTTIGLYLRYVDLKETAIDWCFHRCLKKERKVTAPDDLEQMAEYLWANLENIQYIQVHAAVIFFIILSYSCVGGALFSWLEGWTFFDSFYFSFISILKIGFGDVVPERSLTRWLTILYALIGLTISTMCVDVVGVHYVDRIHRFGRSMGKGDYLEMLRRIKYRSKRRDALANLHHTLMILGRLNPSALNSLKSWSASESEGPVSPPEIPESVRAVKITPYSITVVWSPPAEPSKSLRFVLSYRMKHSKNQSTVNIPNVSTGEYEIKSLTSFSIYEIAIHAANSIGRSNSIRLVQITEPESSPQDLTAQLESPITVNLTWKAPFKQQSTILGWSIYYTKDEDAPFDNWTKVLVDVEEYCLSISDLLENTRYSFCISSVCRDGHSPISRSVHITTGSLIEEVQTATAFLDEEHQTISPTTIPQEQKIPQDEEL